MLKVLAFALWVTKTGWISLKFIFGRQFPMPSVTRRHRKGNLVCYCSIDHCHELSSREFCEVPQGGFCFAMSRYSQDEIEYGCFPPEEVGLMAVSSSKFSFFPISPILGQVWKCSHFFTVSRNFDQASWGQKYSMLHFKFMQQSFKTQLCDRAARFSV